MADKIATETTPGLNRWQTALLLIVVVGTPPVVAIMLALAGV